MKSLSPFTTITIIVLSLLALHCWSTTIAQNEHQNSTDTFLAAHETNEDEEQPRAEVDEGEVDISNLLKALGVSNCIERCLESKFLKALSNLLHFDGVFDQMQEICRHFQSAKKCVHSNTCFGTSVFDAVTSGLQSMCDDPKQQFLRKNEQCLRPILDFAGQKCEQECHLVHELANFTHRAVMTKGQGITHLFGLLKDLDNSCSAANCFLPCFRDELSSKCPKAGGVIVDGLLRPFYQLANFILKSGPGMRKLVDEKIPSTCNFLTEKDALDKLVNPNRHDN